MRRDKVHEYLGMTLDYTVCFQVSIMMFSYIVDILTDFDELDLKGKGTKSSAAPNNIFGVNKYCKILDQVIVVEFHCIVAKTFMILGGKGLIIARPLYF